MKIGIFGGSFNPIHNGHILAAQTLQQRYQFDRLFFIPTCNTPLKDPKLLAGPEHRRNMVELAIKEVPNAELSTIELDKQGVSYTIDTITHLKNSLGEDNEYFWIVGYDSFSLMRQWKEYPKLFSLMHFIVIVPPGIDFPLGVLPGTLISKYQRGDFDDAFVNKQGFKIYFENCSPFNIHSTEIRERIKKDIPISKMVPQPVLDYIMKYGLYGAKS
ncbi:MAG: nicotinate (nicotinamide) nucleotide adenylyltransferase [Deltaproteobacteria bacterium RIFCSPHIGHO2_12_FULL_43_9]|nr:MAG: nicotinate (nicotinamide) nucleotide adenylyltransferase [Deltaproteobacteria bacterium RIFCSPHIGHO2_12_FULL_43_9]